MRRRSGFTIVELLVSLALIMFIMAILSEAFIAGLKSFRDLKATADLAERLRSASTIMRRELAANHFDGQSRLSSPDFWQSEGTGNTSPRREGFFRIYQGSKPTYEGSDSTELAQATRFMDSNRATDHMLHFTVKLRGNERADFFYAGNLPATTTLTTSPLFQNSLHYQENTTVFSSQWAEVVYFLRPAVDSSSGAQDNANGTPLFALYRRQLLLVPDSNLLAANSPATGNAANFDYPEMSCSKNGGNIYFNNPRDVTMPVRRFGMTAGNLAGKPSKTYLDPVTGATKETYPTMGEDNATYLGADLLMRDVISFEIRVLPSITQTGGPHFVDLFDADLSAYNGNNTQYPAAAGTTGPRIFDTWSNMIEKPASGGITNDYSTFATTGKATSIPFTTGLKIKGIQIILRVWDNKTEQSRQVTIVQDL